MSKDAPSISPSDDLPPLTFFKTDRSETKSQVTITVYPFDDGKMTRMSVYQGIDIRSMKWEHARVNWPSIGAVDYETANRFAEAIRFASSLAQVLNERVGQLCPAAADAGVTG